MFIKKLLKDKKKRYTEFRTIKIEKKYLKNNNHLIC